MGSKGRKIAVSILFMLVLAVFAFLTLTSCTKEEIDKAKDASGRIIDVIDKLDEVEKEIEEIIGEEAPISPVEKAGYVKPGRAHQPMLPPGTINCYTDKIPEKDLIKPASLITEGGVVSEPISPISSAYQAAEPSPTIVIIEGATPAPKAPPGHSSGLVSASPASYGYYPEGTRWTAPGCIFDDHSAYVEDMYPHGGPSVLYENCNGGWYVGDCLQGEGSSFWDSVLEDIPSWNGVCDWYQG